MSTSPESDLASEPTSEPTSAPRSGVRTALVIGGGIAGPVVATALHRVGIRATVYEARPAPHDGIGGSLALAPNGMAALGLIGVDDAVRALATPASRNIMSIDSHTQELPTLKDVEPLQVVGRGDLHRILRERALAAGVRFEYGKKLLSVSGDPGASGRPGGVTARFADGTEAAADILIGADGVHSTVRKLIDPDAPSAGYTGMLGLQGYVEPGPDLDFEPGAMTFAFGRNAYYLYWKQADGLLTWGANLPSKKYLSLKEARAIPAEDWLRTLRETYAPDTPGRLLAERTAADSLDVVGGLHIMPPVPHWYSDRMVLVGDAVHAPSNSTGQGASLAIESALQLARCLRDRPDPRSAFASYEQLRRERVERITKRGARTNFAKTPGPVARKLMHVTMPLFFRLMNFDKVMGWEQRYRIDWDAVVN